MLKWTRKKSADGPLPARRYAQGTLYYRNGEYGLAVEELAHLRGQNTPIGQMGRYYEGMAHRAMAIDFLREGDYEQSEHHFRAAIELLGRQAELTGYLASLYAHTQKYSQCAEQMDRLAPSQNTAASWSKLAQAQWRSGQRAQAYLTIENALRSFGSDASLHLQQGMFYAAEERFLPASESLSRAAQLDAGSADAHYYLGLVAAAGGDARAAIRSFQRALFLRPTDLVLAYQLALSARAAAKEGAGVVVCLPEKLSTGPVGTTQAWQMAQYVADEADFVDAMLSLPATEADAELFEMLHGVVQMALSAHRGYADLHFNASCILTRLGRTDEAIAHARQAVEINPRYVRALVHLGKLLRTTQPQAALEHLKTAIAAGADWPDVHYLAGELNQIEQRQAAAREHLRRALQLNPNYQQAQRALRGLAA